MSFDLLEGEQTIFSFADALDPDHIPKLLPHRENQQLEIRNAIRPLLHGRTGDTLLIRGGPGFGKTVVVKRMLMSLDEEDTSDKKISHVYINCWRHNTTYKIIVELAHELGYKFTHNKNTSQIIDEVKRIVEQKDGVVLAFDEIDKIEDYDFLYFILEEIKRKTLLLITNDSDWGTKLDDRIKSRLTPIVLEFKSYVPDEIKDILKDRIKLAFYQNVWTDEAFNEIVDKAINYSDIRAGITLLKVTGEIAEKTGSRKVKLEHAKEAINNTSAFKIKVTSDLAEEEQHVLDICKTNSGQTTGELYKIYIQLGGQKSNKTFTRYLQDLEIKKLIKLDMTGEGFAGKSSVITYIGDEKRLTEF